MVLLVDIFLFAVFCVVLVESSSICISAVSKIAYHFKISEFIISFLIVGFVSTFPEASIAITSAIKQTPEIGIGTLIGNNVADLTLVLGIIALLGKNIKLKSKIFENTSFYLLLSGLPALLLLDGTLSRLDGIVLVLFSVTYFGFIIAKRIKSSNTKINHKNFKKNIIYMLFGLFILLISSNLVVTYATKISIDLTIPPLLVGLFLVSLGATLPELTLSIRAVTSRHKQLAVGDILGNVIIDASFILGIVGIISPITFSDITILFSVIVMFFVSLMVLFLIEYHKHLNWKEGIILIIIYILFVLFGSRIGTLI